MMISTKGRYALRAIIDLAQHSTEDTFVPLAEIAERQNISEKYLESIVSSLSKAGLVSGVRGKGGGYRLTRPATEYTVSEILRVTEGTLAPVACLDCENDSATCDRMDSCLTLPMWRGLSDTINSYLASYTIDDLIQQGRERDGEGNIVDIWAGSGI